MQTIGVTVVRAEHQKDVYLDFDEDANFEDVRAAIARSIGADADEMGVRVERTGQLIVPNSDLGTEILHGDRLLIEQGFTTASGIANTKLVNIGSGEEILLTKVETLVGRTVNGAGTLRVDSATVSAAHATITVDEGRVNLVDHDSTNGTWINGARVHSRGTLTDGDQVRFGDKATFTVVAPWTRAAADHLSLGGGRVQFNRPPRRDTHRPETLITLPDAPAPHISRRLPLPTIVAPMAIGLLIFLFTSNAMFLLFAGMGPLMAGWNWVDDRRTGRKRYINDARLYREHLQMAKQQLASAHETAIRWRDERLPRVTVQTERAIRWSEELWDRRRNDDDFLDLRIGIADQPSLVHVEMSNQGDPDLIGEARDLEHQFRYDTNVPLVLELGSVGMLGITGDEEACRDLARWLMIQIACRHSPKDVILTYIAPQGGSHWRWIRWLPHAVAAAQSMRGPAAKPASVSPKMLADYVDAQRTDPNGLTRVLVALVDANLDLHDSELRRVRRLSEDPANNLVLIWLAQQRTQLPGECTATIDIDADRQIKAHSAHLHEQVANAHAERVSESAALSCARALAPLRDPSAVGGSAGIPDKVGLLELLGLPRITSAAVKEAWANHDGGLRAPIGIDEHGELLFLDLSSEGDGPHGLVAGTTGAGKSELLQSFIASFAYRYPPSHLTFLFIDYKGGAAFKDCIRLPHAIGQLTNLDQGLADRARRSLQAELRYRQRLFSEHSVKDLEQMRSKVPDLAPPALLIVFDEFASLVDDVPEFVDSVVDIAEKGRSLGVHMVLATQTPGGSINRKIQNCVNFRIAFRLKEESESQQVVDTSDAVRIPSSLPGRGLVRLGSGDLVRFQSAYASGASAQHDGPRATARTMIFDGSVAKDTGHALDDAPADLTSIVSSVVEAASDLQLKQPRRPWIAELPSAMELTPLVKDDIPRSGVEAPIGVADFPDRQAQETYRVDFAVMSNVLVVGGPGSGKTTALRTIAASMAQSHSPRVVQMYGMDFAGRGLRALEQLPHVRGIAQPDQPARVRAAITRVRREISERRAKSGDDPGEEGIEASTLLVLVDGLLPLMLFLEDLDGGEHLEAFLQAVGDGPGVGVHFVIATDQPQRIPMTISNTTGERLVLPLPNQDAYYAAGAPVPGGRHPTGRAISSALRAEVQIAVATSDSSRVESSDQDAYIADLGRALHGKDPSRASPLQVLDTEVSPAQVGGTPNGDGVIALGLDDVDLEPATVDFGRVPTLLVIGPDLSGRSNLLAWVNQALDGSVDGHIDTILIGPRASAEVHRSQWNTTYRHPMEAIEQLEQLAHRDEDSSATSWTLIGLDDCDDLLESPIGGSVEERQNHARYSEALDQIVRSARLNRYVIVATGQFTALLRSQGWARRMLQNEQAVILSPSSLASGHVDPRFNVRLPRRTDYKPTPGRGVLVRRSETNLIQTIHLG